MRERKGYKPVKMTTHEQDKDLVRLALEGNQKAYNDLLRKYKPILYTAAKRRLPNKGVEELEDIVMIVLGQAFIKIAQYDPEKSKFYTWMVACIHNYINGIPKQKKRVYAESLEDLYPSNADSEDTVEYPIPSEDDFDMNIDREQLTKLVRLLIDKLPSDLATVITMKYFKDCSHREIAEAVGCKENEVWYKLKRAKELLKRISDRNNLF
jgi:RNA polymerase sigma-70 factor (ECF subfamily)